jgi:hypothetical protein|tara:strand:+ start:1150 stop:1350 length:201 start_codon:yes stop_codon:yes gene_type:complete
MARHTVKCNNYNRSKEKQMAKKNSIKKFSYLEKWNTRNGQQERVVIREQGRFVDSINITGLRNQKV